MNDIGGARAWGSNFAGDRGLADRSPMSRIARGVGCKVDGVSRGFARPEVEVLVSSDWSKGAGQIERNELSNGPWGTEEAKILKLQPGISRYTQVK